MAFEDLNREGLIELAKPFGTLIERVGTVGGAWIDPMVLRAFQAHGVSLSRNHYYSVIPDIEALPDRLWRGKAFEHGWSQVSQSDYVPALEGALDYLEELRDTPRSAIDGFYWNNPMFPPLDAAVYYGLIRWRRPARILEIGSGFSAILAIAALAANRSGKITCIEPEPRAELVAREAHLDALHRLQVQDAPDGLFETLEPGDVLFIDTSHTSKAGSDVHDIIFRILPLLKPGVIVHIHDIFLPYEYPRSWFEDIGIVWNEQYAVLALLMNSTRYRVMLPNYLACVEKADWLATRFQGFDIDNLTMNLGGPRGASLWVSVAA